MWNHFNLIRKNCSSVEIHGEEGSLWQDRTIISIEITQKFKEILLSVSLSFFYSLENLKISHEKSGNVGIFLHFLSVFSLMNLFIPFDSSLATCSMCLQDDDDDDFLDILYFYFSLLSSPQTEKVYALEQKKANKNARDLGRFIKFIK